jgi:hypothetical protein
MDAEVEINNTWETITRNSKTSAKESPGYYEPKKHEPWFDGGCTKLLDQKKMQCLRDHCEINGDNLNNVRRETRRYFRKRGGIIYKTELITL